MGARAAGGPGSTGGPKTTGALSGALVVIALIAVSVAQVTPQTCAGGTPRVGEVARANRDATVRERTPTRGSLAGARRDSRTSGDVAPPLVGGVGDAHVRHPQGATLHSGWNFHAVTLEDPAPTPRRIITIAPSSAEVICALGAADRIVGVSKFCVYPPELKSKTRVGGLYDTDLERIIALKPDLVVLRGRSESVERLCKKLGIAVYHDRTEKLADIETCVIELGRRLGRDAQAAALVDRFRSRLEAIKKSTTGKPRPRALLTVSRRQDAIANVLTTGKGTFLNEMLEIAGGQNVFGHLDMAWPQVSPEAIVAQRPAVIIELMPELELTGALKRQMLDQWARLGPIPAVTHGRIHFITDEHAQIPSLRYVEIIEKVSRILHPEVDIEPRRAGDP